MSSSSSSLQIDQYVLRKVTDYVTADNITLVLPVCMMMMMMMMMMLTTMMMMMLLMMMMTMMVLMIAIFCLRCHNMVLKHNLAGH